MSKVITGLFNNSEKAAAAIYSLEVRGIDPDNISLIANEGFDKNSFAVRTHSKLPEGVALGATAGGAITALVAGLTAVGTIAATGGLGLLAAGPLVSALAGAGAGAIGGSIIGGAIGAAIPEHEVKHYEDALKKGAVLVGVTYENSDQKDLVKNTLDHCDADKISHA